MNFLVLTLAVVVALVMSGTFWWSSRNLLASVSAFVLMVGLVAIVMTREVDPIAQDNRQQSPGQQSTPGQRSSEQDASVKKAALSMKELEEYRPLEVPTHGTSDRQPARNATKRIMRPGKRPIIAR